MRPHFDLLALDIYENIAFTTYKNNDARSRMIFERAQGGWKIINSYKFRVIYMFLDFQITRYDLNQGSIICIESGIFSDHSVKEVYDKYGTVYRNFSYIYNYRKVESFYGFISKTILDDGIIINIDGEEISIKN